MLDRIVELAAGRQIPRVIEAPPRVERRRLAASSATTSSEHLYVRGTADVAQRGLLSPGDPRDEPFAVQLSLMSRLSVLEVCVEHRASLPAIIGKRGALVGDPLAQRPSPVSFHNEPFSSCVAVGFDVVQNEDGLHDRGR
ncbi:hypothetical protein, partial [Actinoplanes sp. GCM10030250]|uniref:hypothetical protein n=1 Tax=Actinoplanes sp. GCM10030250 TaxID=3273376 RepID=UPI00360679F9